jgi:1,4-dihydroxy-2-naphthoate octaprenyltransferase
MKPAFSDILGLVRAPFLLLNFSCVAAGAGTAYWRTGSISWKDALLALVGAVLAHAAVNSLNEYSDFKTGVDSRTSRTPFSGGSGTLQKRPGLAGYALGIGLACAALTASIGVYFILRQGWAIIPLGLLGLVVILLYTPWLTRIPVLCLVAPGLGFGTAMVMGTDLVLGGGPSMAGFAASLVPFFLVNNLLLLNQFPDVKADRTAGRRNIVIVYGSLVAARVYSLFYAGAHLSVVIAVAEGVLPPLSLLALFTVPLAVRASLGAFRDAGNSRKLLPALRLNVVSSLATPLLLAVGLFLSH